VVKNNKTQSNYPQTLKGEKMKRWHETIAIMKKRKKVASVWKEKSLGFFNKKDPYDCGHTKCMRCHSYKFPKRKLTRKEKTWNIIHQEMMDEFLNTPPEQYKEHDDLCCDITDFKNDFKTIIQLSMID
jgi:hypothetical protein